MTAPATPATPGAASLRAMVDFACMEDDCKTAVVFDLMEMAAGCQAPVRCPQCHRDYHLDPAFLQKLERLRRLIVTVQEAADILGDVNVAITTPAGEVRIPYWLMLTRLNTIVTLDVGGRKVEFNFRVEPLNTETFR